MFNLGILVVNRLLFIVNTLTTIKERKKEKGRQDLRSE